MYLYLWLKNWLEQQEGQDLVEYALLIVLVSIVAIAALTLLGRLPARSSEASRL